MEVWSAALWLESHEDLEKFVARDCYIPMIYMYNKPIGNDWRGAHGNDEEQEGASGEYFNDTSLDGGAKERHLSTPEVACRLQIGNIYLYICVTYTLNLRLGIAVPGLEKERGRSRGISKGVKGSSEEAPEQPGRAALRSLDGFRVGRAKLYSIPNLRVKP